MEHNRLTPPMLMPSLYVREGCLLTALILTVGIAQANPTAPVVLPTPQVVTSGSAKFQNQGNNLTATNLPGTIINWQSFSIGAGATSRLIQQSATSAVLNRANGTDQTMILGRLVSNGAVSLINPNGTPFSPAAKTMQGSSAVTAPQSALTPFQTGSLSSAPASQPAAAHIPPQSGAVTMQLAKRDLAF